MKDIYHTGKLIVENVRAGQGYFEGTSVRELAKLIDSSTSTLYRAVKAFEVVNRYKLHTQLDKLQPTLLYNLERLPESQRKKVVNQSVKEGWSKREVIRQTAQLLEGALGEEWPLQRVRTKVLSPPRAARAPAKSAGTGKAPRSSTGKKAVQPGVIADSGLPRVLPHLGTLRRIAEQLSKQPPDKKKLSQEQVKRLKARIKEIQKGLARWEKSIS
ncbi:MAG: hypothetical protein RJA70_2588 [Pseudomonadota bacterium]